MNTPSERHNAAIRPVLKHMIDLVGDNPTELLVLAESLVLGLFLLIVRLGGDEPVLDIFTENLRVRLAEQRLGNSDTKGAAVMVAYSFKPQFVQPISSGLKHQTLRNDRKRHARAGEPIQLYTGMRTRRCRLIGTATCVSATPLGLDLAQGRVVLATGSAIQGARALDAFAKLDGFPDWAALAEFWRVNHPNVPQWQGVRISWRDFVPGPERSA